ncbi:hypothetical protein [Paraflavitalea sp. CAU 1676]|nr:hypothetical protein [Paraflavitalea sp. CAU 1676]MDF2188006.1 hypothetical protein [Paraflavitalea sp. CAU 1676]
MDSNITFMWTLYLLAEGFIPVNVLCGYYAPDEGEQLELQLIDVEIR